MSVVLSIDATKWRLFVIDGGKELRADVREIYGQTWLIQRCRTNKVSNVLERLPGARLAAQVKVVMHAPYQLERKTASPSSSSRPIGSTTKAQDKPGSF